MGLNLDIEKTQARAAGFDASRFRSAFHGSGVSSEHAVPVKFGETPAFEEPHTVARAGLVDGESFGGVSVVVEFREHHFTVACDEGAGGVAIVGGGEFVVASEREEVLDEDGGLFSDGGAGA